MPRQPAPPLGMIFDESFPAILAEARGVNPAVHDGAVMVGRPGSAAGRYTIAGWSYRLFPGECDVRAEDNRGSAFNSCVAMSTTEGVDALYLISGAGIVRCVRGIACPL